MKIKIVFLLFLVLLISISFSQTNLVIYQQNIGVVSFEKEVNLRKGLNFVSLEEISGGVSPENIYVISTRGNIIKEIVYPSIGLWIEASQDSKDILKIFYVISNIKWSAQHTFFIDGNNYRFNSKVVIQNNSDLNFQRAKISVLAGNLNIERRSYALSKSELMLSESYVSSLPEVETVQGYKIFDIAGEWSISKGSIKIIPIIDTIIKEAKKRYVLGYKGDVKNVYILWNILNRKENGLGVPIPSGLLSLFTVEGGKIIFLGSSNIPNISEGDNIEIVQGQDFDLSGERRVLEEKRRIEGKYEVIERKVSIEVKNAKKEKVLVEIRESILGDEIEIKGSNFPFEKIDKNNYVFRVSVEAEKKSVLNYTCVIKNLR